MVADLPEWEARGRWPRPSESVDMEEAARLAAVAVNHRSPRLWTLVTRRGIVQRIVHAGMERAMAQDQPLLSRLNRRDAPIALIPGDRGDLVIITRWGNAIRFALHTIETQGSQALDLDPDDEVVGALNLSGDDRTPGHEMLIVTASGYGLRRDVAQLPARARPGDTPGKALIQAQDVLGLFHSSSNTRLIFATYGGRLIFASSDQAARHDRLAKGARLCDLDHDPAVAVTLIP
jgi:DNA gyrase subunit A